MDWVTKMELYDVNDVARVQVSRSQDFGVDKSDQGGRGRHPSCLAVPAAHAVKPLLVSGRQSLCNGCCWLYLQVGSEVP